MDRLDAVRMDAACWYMRMREADAESPDRTRFERWLMSDASHQAAYRLVEETMADFSSTERLQHLSQAVAQQQFFDQAQQQKKSAKWRRGLGTLVLALGVGLLAHKQYQHWQTAPVYAHTQSTAIAQISTQTLIDGTKITANANTKLQVTYFRHQRLVELTQGEAIFEVTKDPDKPFVVKTRLGDVTVLGTRFAVNQLQHLVRISVDHGKVRVSANEAGSSAVVLVNGQVAELHAHTSPQRIKREAADGFGFASGWVVFDRADMAEVAETLSRYRHDPVVTAIAAGQGPKLNAVMQINQSEQFLRELPASVPVTIQKHATQTQINRK